MFLSFLLPQPCTVIASINSVIIFSTKRCTFSTISYPCPAYLCAVLAADINSEDWRIRSHLAVCGFHNRGLGLIQTEEIPSVGGELPDLFKGFAFMSMSACLCAHKAASMGNVDRGVLFNTAGE